MRGGRFAIARRNAKTQVIAHIKTFEVSINGRIHYVQSPQYYKKKDRVIDVSSKLGLIWLNRAESVRFTRILYLTR